MDQWRRLVGSNRSGVCSISPCLWLNVVFSWLSSLNNQASLFQSAVIVFKLIKVSGWPLPLVFLDTPALFDLSLKAASVCLINELHFLTPQIKYPGVTLPRCRWWCVFTELHYIRLGLFGFMKLSDVPLSPTPPLRERWLNPPFRTAVPSDGQADRMEEVSWMESSRDSSDGVAFIFSLLRLTDTRCFLLHLISVYKYKTRPKIMLF